MSGKIWSKNSTKDKSLDEGKNLEALFAHYVDRLNSGEKLDAEKILAENPQLGKELLEYLEGFIEAGLKRETANSLGTFGDYKLLRQIGRGGMGVVYEAWQSSLDRRVALKVLPVEVAADSKAFTRFVREAKVAGKMNHPNFVAVYGMGFEEGMPFFAMEFVEGETLAKILKQLSAACDKSSAEDQGQVFLSISRLFHPNGNPDEASSAAGGSAKPAAREFLSPNPPNGQGAGGILLQYCLSLARAFAEVAEGLQHAHGRGVIHRDLKPSNLILDREGRLRILDFGLAHLEGQESLTRMGDVVGTPLYMSPEQASTRKMPLDHRTDIYSLGATLYEMLALRPPFRGSDSRETLRQIVSLEPRPLRKLNPGIPRDLETIVLKCLCKESNDRYGTAEALAQDLRRLERGDPVEARPQLVWEKLARRALKRRGQLLAAASFLLLLFTSGLLTYSRYQEVQKENAAHYRERILEAVMNLELLQQSLEKGSAGPAKLPNKVSPTGEGSLKEAFAAGLLLSENRWRELAETTAQNLEGAIGLFPGKAEAHYHQARALRFLGRDEEAENALARALSRDPSFLPARILREGLLRKRAALQSSESRSEPVTIESVGDSKTGWREAWLSAHRAMEEKRWLEAGAACGRLLELEGDVPDEYLGLTLEMRLQRGRARLLGRDYVGALEDFSAAKALWPQLLTPVLLLGKIYFLQGYPERAKEIFENYFSQSRSPAEVALNIAAVYESLAEYREGLAWTNKAAKSPSRERQRAQLFLFLGGLEEALQEGRAALEMNPGDAAAHLVLGVIYIRQNQVSQALEECRKAIEIDPSNALAQYYHGYVYHYENRFSEAVQPYSRAIEIHPDVAVFHTNLGNALLGEGKAGEAVKEFQQAIDLSPDNHVAFTNLARAYFVLERWEESSRAFLEALRIDPQYFIPRSELKRPLRQLAEANKEKPDPSDIQKGIELVSEGLRLLGREDLELFELLSDFQALQKNFREAVLALDEALRLPEADNEILLKLKDYSKRLLPDLVSYASVDGTLEALEPGSELERKIYGDFKALCRPESRSQPLLYFEGRLLERSGNCREASQRFLGAIALDGGRREPFLRLIESLRAAGEHEEAERWALKALQKGFPGSEDFLDLWILIAFKDLKRNPEDALAVFPHASEAGGLEGQLANLRWGLEQLSRLGINQIPAEVLTFCAHSPLAGRIYADTLNALFPGIWENLKRDVYLKNTIKSTPFGNTNTGAEFDDVPPEGALLTGFKATFRVWNGRRLVRSLQPIFYGSLGRKEGLVAGLPMGQVVRFEAKPGYAIGGILGGGEETLSAMKIQFLRIQGDRLDPQDAYESPWLGDPGVQKVKKLGGEGRLVGGIYGYRGHNISVLGLVGLGPPLAENGAIDAALSAPEALVAERSSWRALPGEREPPPEWASIDFDDRSWAIVEQDLLFQNRGNLTWSGDEKNPPPEIFLRHAFSGAGSFPVKKLFLKARAEGDFIAYLNGTEVARVRSEDPETWLPFERAEKSDLSSPLFEVEFPLDPGLLRPGRNVLCLKAPGFLDSTGAVKEGRRSCAAVLLCASLWGEPDYSNGSHRRLEKLRGFLKEEGDGSRVAYLESRILALADEKKRSEPGLAKVEAAGMRKNIAVRYLDLSEKLYHRRRPREAEKAYRLASSRLRDAENFTGAAGSPRDHSSPELFLGEKRQKKLGKDFPETPENRLPANCSLFAAFPVILEASPFRHEDPRAAHRATRWQVRQEGELIQLVLDFTSDTNLCRLPIPQSRLLPRTTYFWRAAFFDANGKSTPFSSETSFRTGDFEIHHVQFDMSRHFNRDGVANPGDRKNDSLSVAAGFSLLVENGFDGFSKGNSLARGLPRDRRVGCHVLGDYSVPNAYHAPREKHQRLRMEVPRGKYSSIRFLSAGIGGDSEMPVIFEFTDGTAQKGAILCPDWHGGLCEDPASVPAIMGKSHPDLVPAMSGMACINGWQFEDRNCTAIFETIVEVGSEKELAALVLEAEKAIYPNPHTRFNLLAATGVILKKN
ncbi:MAG: protein kinase [Planctomycetes bacterium]|nr:protein kinase [Planctomycetota bacterium]